MRTTEPESIARGDIQAFEDLLVGMKGAIEFVLPTGPNPSRTSLLIFDDDVQFHFLVPQNADGLAVSADDHGRPLIVVETGGSPLVSRHELTHRLVFQRLPRAPTWLNEGLAEYFSVTSFKNGTARLGIPTPRLRRLTSSRFEKARIPQKLLVDEMPTLKELLNADEATIESDEKYYIAAWAAVHYLANGGADHVQRFRSFLNAIAKGETAEAALTASYDAPSALEPRYRDYLKKCPPCCRRFANGPSPFRWRQSRQTRACARSTTPRYIGCGALSFPRTRQSSCDRRGCTRPYHRSRF